MSTPALALSAIETFMLRLEGAGLLRRVARPVDWKLELGELSRREQRRGGRAQALLFERIKDYPGARVLTNGCATRRHIAVALGLSPELSGRRLISHIASLARAPADPLLAPMCTLKTPFESVRPVDLTALPIPWWHPQDSGRYLGTWHVNITNHPQTGQPNVGVYRMQLLDSRHATVSVSAYSHLQRHLSVARCRGESLPMAVAIGMSETVVMAGAAALPYGTNELGFAGALQGSPLTLAPCETIPCLVPADSQYVIEGRIHPRQRVTDGPFFDYTGRPSVNPAAFLFEVSAIRHCPNPVFRGAAIGLPGAEDHELYSYLAACNLVDFHGNRLRNRLQRLLFTNRRFRLLQLSGRLSSRLSGKAEG